MRFACFLVLLLAAAPGVSAQVASAPGGGAQAAQPAPTPRLATPQPAETIEPALRDVKHEARGMSAGPTQDKPRRTVWFLVGALAAVAVILALTL